MLKENKTKATREFNKKRKEDNKVFQRFAGIEKLTSKAEVKMDRVSKLISTNGKYSKSKSSFGNYKVEVRRLWTDYYGKQSIVNDSQLFFRVSECKDFIKTLPIDMSY